MKTTDGDASCETMSLPTLEPRIDSVDLFKASIGGLDASSDLHNNIEAQSLPLCGSLSLILGPTISRRSTLDGADQRSCVILPGPAESDAFEQPALSLIGEPQLEDTEELNTPSAGCIERTGTTIRVSSVKRKNRSQAIGSDDDNSIPQDQSKITLSRISNGSLIDRDNTDVTPTYATMQKVSLPGKAVDVSVVGDSSIEKDYHNHSNGDPLLGIDLPIHSGTDKQSHCLNHTSPRIKQPEESTSERTQLEIPSLSIAYPVGKRNGPQATTDNSAASNDPQFKDTSVHALARFAGEPCEQRSKSTIDSIGALTRSLLGDKSSAEIDEAINVQRQLCDYARDTPPVVAPSPRVVAPHQSAAEDGHCSEEPSGHDVSTDTNVSSMTKEQPESRTRSGARFSDDTTLLKDFLHRAQARKAGKVQKNVSSASDIIASPRKPLAVIDKNSPSPKKSKSRANRLFTPPGKPKVESVLDGENPLNGPGSCRRSARTKSPAPSKILSGAPSLIPVRRADSTEHVVLQRSDAQELATVTRANTRRNKGHAKPPKLMLESIAPEVPDTWLDATHPKGSVKAVSWDETLAYFFTTTEGEDEKEKQTKARPKAKRLKGLGATNGTPAPRKMITDMATSNGEVALKCRTKTRT